MCWEPLARYSASQQLQLKCTRTFTACQASPSFKHRQIQEIFPFPLTFSKTWMLIGIRSAAFQSLCESLSQGLLLTAEQQLRNQELWGSCVGGHYIHDVKYGRFAWEPSESSLFRFYLFIQFSAGFRDRVFLLSGLFCYPWVNKQTNLCKKMDFIHCGKVSVYGGKKCVPHSLHMMNLRFMWR